jgi:hypothetical protein
MQLFLEDGLQLRRETFVKTEFRYELSWRLLTPYDETGRRFKLHSVALRELMVYLHTPYLKLDDVEPDPVAWNGKSKKTSLADCSSNSGPDNHSDLDKVNILQAKLFKWLFKVGSNPYDRSYMQRRNMWDCQSEKGQLHEVHKDYPIFTMSYLSFRYLFYDRRSS